MTTFSELKRTAAELPNKPGVYLFRDEKKALLYVGKARDLRRRVTSYFQKMHSSRRIGKMVDRVRHIDIIITATEAEALLLENSLIKNNKPRMNILLRDDKTYPYIKVTRERFPRVVFTRYRPKTTRAKYFGPFPSARAARRAIQTLHRHFRVRPCTLDLDRKSCAPCLQYHIKRCDAPCAGLVSEHVYGLGIRRAELFLQGRTDSLIDRVSSEMAQATRNLEFEKAAYFRDLIGHLRSMQRVQTVANLPFDKADVVGLHGDAQRGCILVLTIRNRVMIRSSQFSVEWEHDIEEDAARLISHYVLNHADPPNDLFVAKPGWFDSLKVAFAEKFGHGLNVRCPKRGAGRRLLDMAEENARSQFDLGTVDQGRARDALVRLADAIGMPVLPRRMECFDISHTQGKQTVASMVQFQGGKPNKKMYRHYNIKSVCGIDDVASMEEVITRRYDRLLRAGEELPELIVVDGGVGQLGAAHRALAKLGLEQHPLIALAKKEEDIHVDGQSQPLRLAKNDPALRLLQHIRDEAHRFGVTFHRKKRSKAMLHSELDGIPGLGTKRIHKLLRHFGSVRDIRAASADQLVQAIGPKIGRRVFDYFRLGGA